MPQFFAKHAWLPSGWESDVLFDVDDNGFFQTVRKKSQQGAATALEGLVIPAMPNLHSHAFQRAMAGMSEYATGERDSFWTWRKLMYDFMSRFGPEELEDIAYKLYCEMRAAGYSHVGEFHYIHHTPDGTPYNDRAELSHAMIRAAKKAGIGITLLPVLYIYSGFGASLPEDGQRRFINSPEDYCAMVADLHKTYKNDPLVKIGIAFHSLRAVTPDIINEVIKETNKFDDQMPIHIHIAEQEKEVEDCLAHNAVRPVEYLYNHVDIDKRWCLVHATHLNDNELSSIAKSGAVAGLCPITEANLGDGLFRLRDFIEAGGIWGIGSDSHIGVDPLEELRLLEYGQRLFYKERAVARTETYPHVGDYLYKAASQGGSQAMGVKLGAMEKGYRADFLTIGGNENSFSEAHLLDKLIFAGNIQITNTYCAGNNTP